MSYGRGGFCCRKNYEAWCAGDEGARIHRLCMEFSGRSPLALSVLAVMSLAPFPLAVVTQTLVELLGMIVLVHLIPRLTLLRERRPRQG